MNRVINPIIPKPFSPLVDPNVRRIVEESGRSAGKSTTNENVAIALMLSARRNNIWYCRAEKGDIRTSIYNSFIATLNAIGTEDLFTCKLSPMEITCRTTGAKCYFSGINGKTRDDLNATKGFVPQNRTLAMFILDEANEVKSYQHVRAAETTANKFLLPYGKIVYAYNPPVSRKHWANLEFPRMVREGATRIHSTWQDIRRLLNSSTIEEIELMQANDPRHYAYWYGGEIVNLEGRVIWSFDRAKHLLPLGALQRRIGRNIYYQPVQMFYGVDSGVLSDATAISAWALFPDGKLIKLGTFYLDIAKERRMSGANGISHTDQVILMADWRRAFKKRMADYGVIVPGADNERWCFDGAALTQDLMLEWRKTMGAEAGSCVAVTNKDIERDNARLVNSYKSGMLEILDVPDNLVSVEEMENFCYDDQNEIPEGQSDHTIDADKYATYEYYYHFL